MHDLPPLTGPEPPADASRVLSVCSGVGGKDLGFHRGGFRTVGLCEWDEWRRRVLARHWPGVPIHPDLTELADWAERDPDAVREWCGGQPNVLIGGTPCQDLSSAGRRAGLAGERSGLFFAFMRLRHALGIEWTVWENVRGALTSNGGLDFMAVLESFVGAAVALPACGVGGAGVAAGPRGGCVWRLLNAQHFGVPQRRRRVFVVGRLGGECPPQVLLERVGGRGDFAAGGAAGQEPPWAAAARAGGVGGAGLAGRGGGGGRDGRGNVLGARPVGHGFGGNGVAGTLGASGGVGRGHDARPDRGGALVGAAGALLGRQRQDVDDARGGRFVVAPTLAKQGVGTGQFLGSEAGIVARGGGSDGVPAGGGEPGRAAGRRVVAATGEGGSSADDVGGGAAPVDADGVRAADGVAGRVDGDVLSTSGEVAHALTHSGDGGSNSRGRAGGPPNLVATFVKRRSESSSERSPESWGEAEVSRTVSAASAHRQDTPPALVVPLAGDAQREGRAVTPSADAEGRVRLRDPGLNVGEDGDPSYAVSAQGPPPSVFVSDSGGGVGACAFDPLPDGRRYAACGDGVAAPQAHWIALRLGAVMRGEDPDVYEPISDPDVPQAVVTPTLNTQAGGGSRDDILMGGGAVWDS